MEIGYIKIFRYYQLFTIYPIQVIQFFIKINKKSQRKLGQKMNTKEAVAKRIIQLCDRNNLTINELANNSGVPPSTVYSILNTKSKNPGIVTIKKLCDGLGVSLVDFFDGEMFSELEQEIQ